MLQTRNTSVRFLTVNDFEISCQLCHVPFKVGRFRTQSEHRNAALSPSRSFWPEEGKSKQYGCKTAIRRGDAATNASELSNETIVEVFDDVLFSEKTDPKGNSVPVERAKPIRKIDWQAQGEALGEHVAGPNCEDTQSYNGHNISAEEMRTCTTVQCLIEKESQTRDWADWPPEWNSEPDDENFERESNYFLSGLGDRMGSWDDDGFCSPIRHNVGELDPAMGNRRGFINGDMPFHPYCFEIYRRVSEWRMGAVNIDGLAEWWDRSREEFATPMHAAVRRGRDEWWQHRPGDEFLAANPLQIPALTALFEAASRPQEGFNARSSHFPACPAALPRHRDLFEQLPEELRNIVLSELSSKDIANLRLASRTFYHLPITLWHDLLQKELPWIWEAWTDRPYPALTCATRSEFESVDGALHSRLEALDALGGDQQTSIEKARFAHKQGYNELLQPRPVQRLYRLQTDWYWLYCQINREWKNIKGLQNRERIWKTLEFVVRRVNDPSEDVFVMMEEH